MESIIAAFFTGVRGLSAEFQQNPIGAAILAGVVILALICWVTVTWIKYRGC